MSAVTFLMGGDSDSGAASAAPASLGTRDTVSCEVLHALPPAVHRIPTMPRMWTFSRFKEGVNAVFAAAQIPSPDRECVNELIVRGFTVRDMIYACVSFDRFVATEGASAAALLKMRLSESDVLLAPTWMSAEGLHRLFSNGSSSPQDQHAVVNLLPYDLVAAFVVRWPLDCLCWKMTFLELVRIKGRATVPTTCKIPTAVLEQLFGGSAKITKGLLD